MFLGGEKSWAAVGCAFLVFSRHRRFFVILIMYSSLEKAIFMPFNGRLGQTSLF
jgi:hypothetical protein